MLEKLNRGQDLREERPLILGLLDAVSHQPFHGFGAVLVELTEVWGQIASSHHEDYLISSCYLGVWELSRHELKENNSIGIDVRLETVWVVILHPDNLRSHPENGSRRLLHLM